MSYPSYLLPQLMGQQPLPDYGYDPTMPPPIDNGQPGTEHYADAARQVQAQALASMFAAHPNMVAMPGEASPQMPDAAGVAQTVAQQARTRAAASRDNAQRLVAKSETYNPLPLEQYNTPYPTRPAPLDTPEYDTEGFRHSAGNLMGIAGLIGALTGAGGFMGNYGGQAMQAGVAGTRDTYDRDYQNDVSTTALEQAQQDKAYGDQTAAWQAGRQGVQQRNADLAREESTRQRALYGPARLATGLAKDDEATAVKADAQEVQALQKMNSTDLAVITGGRVSGTTVQKLWTDMQNRNAQIRRLKNMPPEQAAPIEGFFDLQTQQGNQIAGALKRAVTMANSATARQKQDEIFKAGENQKQRDAKEHELNVLTGMHEKIAGIQAGATISAAKIQAASRDKDTGMKYAYMDEALRQRGGNDAVRATLAQRGQIMKSWQGDFDNVTKIQNALVAATAAKDKFDATVDSDPVLSKMSPEKKAAMAAAHNNEVLRLSNRFDAVHENFLKNEGLYQQQVQNADNAYGKALAIVQSPPKNAATPTQTINAKQQNPATPIGGSAGKRVRSVSGQQSFTRDPTTATHANPPQAGGPKLRQKPAPAGNKKVMSTGFEGGQMVVN